MFGASEFREPSSTRDCRTSLTGSEPNWEELSARDLPAGVRGVSGELQVEGKKAGAWAAITAVLQRNPSDVKSVLWEPANLKNLEKTRVQVDGVSEQAKQVRLEMKPVFFIKLNWEERWERQGDRIVYRKVSGDDRLRHFCGWMEVQAGPGDAKASRVTLYEEVDAPGRNAHDILAGHLGTIRRILKD